MLLQFSVSNFRSILEPITFSMMAAADQTIDQDVETNNGTSQIQTAKVRHESALIHTDKGNVLSCAAIYGANGSGKSTLLRAMYEMKKLAVYGYRNENFRDRFRPHRLADPSRPIQFEIHLSVMGTPYAYNIEFDKKGIVREELYYSPKGRRAKIFDRKRGEKTVFGTKFKESQFSNGLRALNEYRTLLSCTAYFDQDNEPVQNIYDWFRNDFVFILDGFKSDFEKTVKEELLGDEEKKRKIIQALNLFDVPVQEIELKKQEVRISPDQLPGFLTDEFKKLIAYESGENIDVILHYEPFNLNLNDESDGVKRLFFLLIPLIDGLKKGKTLVCDGLEIGLHEEIVKKLVRLLQRQASKNAVQVIFSIHDTGPLSLETLRKDQIWFTELRNEDRSTDLYSLSEIRDVRPSENIQKGYLNGKYGAVPVLKDSVTVKKN